MYKIIPHTADLRLKVRGRSIEDIFTNALLGMAGVLKKDFCKKAAKYPLSEKVLLGSADTTALLVDFLSEVLTIANIKKAVFCEVKFLKFKSNFLEAIIYGNTVGSFDCDIKAVTYHEAQVKKVNNHWETVIVFDI